MSTFSCPIVRVASVEDHPEADRLSIVKLEGLGYTCIRNKLDTGMPRDQVGDWVVYIPANAIVPDWLLKASGFWDEDAGRGILDGKDHNRVTPRRLRKIYSEGILYPLYYRADINERSGDWLLQCEDGLRLIEDVGTNAAEMLGVTKYEPVIPEHMAGEVFNAVGFTVKYDFERLESIPDMFDIGEPVVALEKLHGTFAGIGFHRNFSHADAFGSNKNIVAFSKGLGSQGLAFKNNDNNRHNVYVKNVISLLEKDLENHVFKQDFNQSFYIFGEIYGGSIQDLSYGLTSWKFAVFDIKLDDNWLPRDQMVEFCKKLNLDVVPLLYEGPFNLDELIHNRDGKTTIDRSKNAHIREGIVVKSSTESKHPIHGRKIVKMISPDYLLRKSKNATEFT